MKFLFTILFSVLSVFAYSQELDCNVTVNTSSIQGTNRQMFTALEESVRDFMNNTVFTNHVFEANQRIECNIMIDIQNIVSADEYKGRLQIQARRPVYGSSYNTVLFNYIDNDSNAELYTFDQKVFSVNLGWLH